ncbi:MAG: DUF4142 domain-containing protein [Acidobacteriaceae bacterium]
MMNRHKSLSLFRELGGVLCKRGIQIALLGGLAAFCSGAGFAQMGSDQTPGGMPSAPGQSMPGQNMPGQSGTGQNGAASRDGGLSNDLGAMADRAFVYDAAQGGMLEMQLGQLAASKASSQAVKDFGQQMVTDHTKLNDQLKPIEQSMGVAPPTKLNRKGQGELKKLQNLSGSDFDKEYLGFTVKNHKSEVKNFESEMKSTTNPQLQSMAANEAKIIQQHLMMAEKLANGQGTSAASK